VVLNSCLVLQWVGLWQIKDWCSSSKWVIWLRSNSLRSGFITLMTHVDFCCRLLLCNIAARLLLHVFHGLLLCCITSCATQIWIATCATICGKHWELIGHLLFVYFSLCNEAVICFICFMLIYSSMSPNASMVLISFFLPSLTKAPDNNTPAIKITSIHHRLRQLKPCLLHVLLQLHFGVVVDRFLLLQQVAQQKSVTRHRG